MCLGKERLKGKAKGKAKPDPRSAIVLSVTPAKIRSCDAWIRTQPAGQRVAGERQSEAVSPRRPAGQPRWLDRTRWAAVRTWRGLMRLPPAWKELFLPTTWMQDNTRHYTVYYNTIHNR